MQKPDAIYDAVIVAAGQASRFGGDIPKQYALLDGAPVVKHSLQAFQAHPLIRRIVMVIGRGHQPYIDQYFSKSALQDVQIVTGADTRSQSVMAGLEALTDQAPDYVLIHDGARPLVTETLITKVCTALKTSPAVIPVTPVTDTIKKVEGGTIDRTTLRAVQTPTGFDYARLHALLQHNTDPLITEESQLFEQAGDEVFLAQGEVRNIKITHPEDIALAGFYQSQHKDHPS